MLSTGEEAVEFIVKKSESTVLFVSTVNWPKLVNSLASLKEQVHTVVYWGKDKINEEVRVSCFRGGIILLYMAVVLAKGQGRVDNGRKILSSKT